MNITDSGLVTWHPPAGHRRAAPVHHRRDRRHRHACFGRVDLAGRRAVRPGHHDAVPGSGRWSVMQYDQPILASDGNLTGPMLSLQWTLPPATVLPSGILFEQIGSPAVADLPGQADAARYLPDRLQPDRQLRPHRDAPVHPHGRIGTSIPVGLQPLPVAVIGETYGAELQANSLSTLTWHIFSGQLPPGSPLRRPGSSAANGAGEHPGGVPIRSRWR